MELHLKVLKLLSCHYPVGLNLLVAEKLT